MSPPPHTSSSPETPSSTSPRLTAPHQPNYWRSTTNSPHPTCYGSVSDSSFLACRARVSCDRDRSHWLPRSPCSSASTSAGLPARTRLPQQPQLEIRRRRSTPAPVPATPAPSRPSALLRRRQCLRRHGRPPLLRMRQSPHGPDPVRCTPCRPSALRPSRGCRG